MQINMITVYFLILATVLGGIVGFLIGWWIDRQNYRKALKIVIDYIEEKAGGELIKIEKILSIKPDNIPPQEPAKERNVVNRAKRRSKDMPQELPMVTETRERVLEVYDRLKTILLEIDKKLDLPTSESSTKEKKKTIPFIVEIPAASEEKEADKGIELDKPKSSPINAETDQPLFFAPTVDEDRQENNDDEGKDLYSQIMNLYNEGIKDKAARNSFWEKFSIKRIGNANAVAQRMGEASEPDFRDAANGGFLAIPDEAGEAYFVVPLFDTTITSSAYNEGGISFAFDCPNYDPQLAASIIKITKLALFECDGEQWRLVENNKGELLLRS
jgi:hypothetical protein